MLKYLEALKRNKRNKREPLDGGTGSPRMEGRIKYT
jgi:hypothetical protein